MCAVRFHVCVVVHLQVYHGPRPAAIVEHRQSREAGGEDSPANDLMYIGGQSAARTLAQLIGHGRLRVGNNGILSFCLWPDSVYMR